MKKKKTVSAKEIWPVVMTGIAVFLLILEFLHLAGKLPDIPMFSLFACWIIVYALGESAYNLSAVRSNRELHAGKERALLYVCYLIPVFILAAGYIFYLAGIIGTVTVNILEIIAVVYLFLAAVSGAGSEEKQGKEPSQERQ